MPPYVIDLRNAEDTRDVVHRAVQALAEGKLVAFPTETVYGLAASGLSATAVEQLLDVKGRPEGKPMALAIKSADDALDYAPQMSPLARRLARRCWPGPVTLVLDCSSPDSLVRQLPEPVQQAVAPAGSVGLRVPGHPIMLDVLRMLAGPLVLSSANRSGAGDPINADEVVAGLGGDVEVVLDDGPCRYGQASTVVRVDGEQMNILREGVVAPATLKRLSSYVIVLVCTGNTCRSPMAEAICRDLLAKRLKCDAMELEDRGLLILSAGISAMPGSRAAAEAIETMKKAGLSLDAHESQPLTESLARQADLVLAMTRAHRQTILNHWPDAADRVQLLCPDENDVSDPIGGPLEVYEQCAAQIRAALERRVAELDLSL